MTRIYTKTGDDGTTGLLGGKRVSKADMRVDAYGSVDELNAVLGLVLSHPLPDRVVEILQRVQDELFIVGAALALPEEQDAGRLKIPAVSDAAVLGLEREIDRCEEELEPLQQFILPGGSVPGALLHFARTVARRAERRCVALANAEKIPPEIIRYLNRLSDLCFVLARCLNRGDARREKNPTFGKG